MKYKKDYLKGILFLNVGDPQFVLESVANLSGILETRFLDKTGLSSTLLILPDLLAGFGGSFFSTSGSLETKNISFNKTFLVIR